MINHLSDDFFRHVEPPFIAKSCRNWRCINSKWTVHSWDDDLFHLYGLLVDHSRDMTIWWGLLVDHSTWESLPNYDFSQPYHNLTWHPPFVLEIPFDNLKSSLHFKTWIEFQPKRWQAKKGCAISWWWHFLTWCIQIHTHHGNPRATPPKTPQEIGPY